MVLSFDLKKLIELRYGEVAREENSNWRVLWMRQFVGRRLAA